MKKFCVIVLALLFVAGIVAQATAEDRLKLSTEFRTRAWYWDNTVNYDDNNNADKYQYFDQRLRIAARITAAPGISANFRVDLSEAEWGRQTTVARGPYGGGQGWNRATTGTPTIQVDRAFGRWSTDLFNLDVGQSYPSIGLNGYGQIYAANQFGVVFRLKLPVVLDFVYSKVSEGDSPTSTTASAKIYDTDEDNIGGLDTQDTDFFGGQANYKKDNWSVGLGGGTFVDNSNVDDSPWGIGLWGSYDMGPLALQGEWDHYGGSRGNVDYMGDQFWVNGQYNIMPDLYVGAHLWYALGDDSKRQITGLSDGGDPQGFADLGPFWTDILPLETLPGVLGGQTQTIPEYDPSGNGAGAIGGTIYAGWRVIKPVLLEGQYLYVTPEDTGLTALNYVNLVALNLTYDFLPNTTLCGSWNWHLPDIDNMKSDAANILVARIQLVF